VIFPGPYPTFPKSWTGMNITGYRSPAFDTACDLAHTTLPETPTYQTAHNDAQTIFAQELPVIPLYTRFKVLAAQPKVCSLAIESAYQEALWNLEVLGKDDTCQP
jgi:ABC-type oligopeptide transport system substrate-binding subunit